MDEEKMKAAYNYINEYQKCVLKNTRASKKMKKSPKTLKNQSFFNFIWIGP